MVDTSNVILQGSFVKSINDVLFLIFGIQQVNMNSESVQKAQSIFKLMEYLKNIKSVQDAKALQETLKERFSNIQFLVLLKEIIMSPHMDQLNKQTMINIRSTAAILLNRCLVLQEESKIFILTLEESVQFFHQVLFNMDISAEIKRKLQPSFILILKREEIQLADFFEEGFQKLVRIVQLYQSKIGQLQNQHFTVVQEITFRKGIKPFQITLELPKKLKDAYNLIIILANIFFQLFGQRTAVYQQKILETWKIFHSVVFRQQTLQCHPDIVLRTLIVWDNFIFNGVDLDRKLYPSYLFIYNWSQFSKELIFLLNYKAMRVDQPSNTYNYFFISEDAENTQLMQLKQKAIEFLCSLTKILEAFQACESLTYKSFFFQNLQQIEQSILTSINYSIKHKHSIVEQTIYINMLNLFSVWIQLKYKQLTEEMRVHFLLQVVIPLIDSELRQYQNTFGPQDRAEELISQLNDCCQSQQQSSKISSACKILEQLVDGSSKLYCFIKQYALQSIISSKIENYQLQTSFNLDNLQRLSNPTAFLLLSITNYIDKDHQDGLKFSILAQIINQSYFPMFTNYEKQFFYYFCGFAHQQIFKYNKNALQYFIKIALSKQYGFNVQCFAFDFLSNICDSYYSQAFSSQLMQIFLTIKIEMKWSIICKMLRSFIYHIDEQKLCEFVSSLLKRVLREAQKTAQLKKKGKPIKANDASLCLATCRQISHSFVSINQRPNLRTILLNSIQYIEQIAILDLDDTLLGICTDVIDNSQELPNNLLNVLEVVGMIYHNGEYRGRNYHIFYASCLQNLNKENKQLESMKQIQAIYDKMIQGLGYLAVYPDDLMDEHFDGISTHLFLMQKIYILYGDKLIQQYKQQTHKICQQLIDKISSDYQPLILSRAMNMMLLCKITYQTQGKTYPIHEIYKLARNNYYLFSYDSSFLIFLLTQVMPEFSEEHISLSISVAIAVCDSWRRYSQDRNLRAKNRLMRQNSILSHVLPPVTLEENPIDQIKIFIQSLNEFSPDWFERLKSNFTQNEIARLTALYGQATQNYNFLGGQTLDEDDDSDSYQSNEATINDANHNDFSDNSRRIIKVSRGLQSNNGRMVDVPTPKKRHYQKDDNCIDQEQSMRKHGGKKQKIQSVIIHQISKKDINSEKIAKRSQRS